VSAQGSSDLAGTASNGPHRRGAPLERLPEAVLAAVLIAVGEGPIDIPAPCR
jgi:hypothetical protein